MVDTEQALSITPLRRARELHGMSRRQLALRAGVSASYVGSLERGDCEPTLGIARRISAVFGLSVDRLFPPDKKGRAA